ncbi:MAG: ADP-ribosylation factor-like protein, partial [Negativibacillus massiliensis]|nr:ADP-ribosylation factor-like protein [Negativibacillus massiliensis]
GQPRELIQAYFDSPKIPVHETKVIFLGDGGAGKTHTIHRIQNNCQSGEYHTEMTPGVEITSFQTQNNDLTLNFWDFGGQEIMPSIHRCFLTQRALYVVVVSTRTGNLTVQARHWLKTIEAFAPGAPVLIAVNCWDNTTSCGVNNELLYEEFPNLQQTVIYSAKCSSQEEFYQNLLLPIEELSRKMDSYSMELPESWFHIEQALRTQKNPYITGSDYFKTCCENGLEDEQIAQWLLEWFNDMGVCFSYSDDNGQPYQVLRPEWLTNAVYRILLEEKEPNSDGIVKRKYIERSLSYPGSGTQPEITYTKSECNAILAVMEKFRLAYSINEQELFIPALCSEKKPTLLIPENCEQRLEYELQYAYLPDCVVHQMMIWYLESSITPKHVWRSGLCVQERTRWAVITGDFRRAKLHIQLYMQPDSSAQNCHDMLRDIYQAIQEINKHLALEATDCIIMHEGNQTAHFPLGPLLEAKKKGWTELPSLEDGEFHVYNIDQILDSAFNPQQVQAVLKQERQNEFSRIVAPTIYLQNITNQNGWTADEVRTFAFAFLEHQNLLTEEVMTKLIDLLCRQKEVVLQQLGKNMSESKTPYQKLKGFISDTAKTGKDLQTLGKLMQAIYTAAPAVLDAMKNLLS